MASRRTIVPAKHLFNGFASSQSMPHRCLTRTMATEANLSETTLAKSYVDTSLDVASTGSILEDGVTVPSRTPSDSGRPQIQRPRPFQPQRNPFLTTTQCTLYSFPSMEPTRLVPYPSTHLAVPLRKDILHRAVIYEGDNTRQGTASTKWRSEVHGSNRKIRPQKGTGKARLGDKKSPMLRGGGVAFGPKPRDFGTDLPQKIYDLAWRTALSYRYSKGELLLVDGAAEIEGVHEASRERYLKDMLTHNGMGHAGGRTLFVTLEQREELLGALAGHNMGRHARALDVTDVDVKDLLELGRVVVERNALDWIFAQHESDLNPTLRLENWNLS